MTGTDEIRQVVPDRPQDIARRMHKSAPPVRPGPRYVGLVTRAVAFVLDAAVVNAIAAIVGAATALVLSVFPVSHDVHTVVVAVGGVLFFVWLAAYFATFWATTGQTPGNRVMSIRVERPDGQTLSPRRALLRVIGLALAAIPLFAGFVPILFTDRRRGLADWLADSVVVTAVVKPHPSQIA